jgi:hypothetical protein
MLVMGLPSFKESEGSMTQSNVAAWPLDAATMASIPATTEIVRPRHNRVAAPARCPSFNAIRNAHPANVLFLIRDVTSHVKSKISTAFRRA